MAFDNPGADLFHVIQGENHHFSKEELISLKQALRDRELPGWSRSLIHKWNFREISQDKNNIRIRGIEAIEV